MKTSGIYMIRNNVNGKVYIGQSVCVEKRRVYHFARLKRGSHQNTHMQSSFNKHGESAFEFCLLFKTNKENLDMMERVWIRHYRSNDKAFGYNRDNGGLSKNTVSDETKLLLSLKNTGKTIPDYVREKISTTMTGYKRSDQHCANLSKALKGRRPSDKCIAASVFKRKGLKLTEDQRKEKSKSWYKSEKSKIHIKHMCEKNRISHEELLRRANMPKPNKKENESDYQKWWKARKRLGLPTRNIK